MLSLRNAVLVLVASAVLVLVLEGVTAAVFTTPPLRPPIAQPAPGSAQAPEAPAEGDRQPPAEAPPAGHPRVPVRQKPVPVAHAHQPAPVLLAPAENRQPVSPPPAPVLAVPHLTSRTVNTEPCFCDGTLRRVPTHWDPPTPQG